MLELRSILAAVATTASAAVAQGQVAGFSCRVAAIPMRDGVHLNTRICEPRGNHPPLPILITLSALASSEFHWRDVLISSVVLTVGSWALFIWGLKLTIPLWPLYVTG